MYIFQFTPLRKGRQTAVSDGVYSFVFQFTPLRKGRPMDVKLWKIGDVNFNSRPYARGDVFIPVFSEKP